jgi:hypothetical protein
MKITFFLLATCSALLSNCATIVGKTSYNVNIQNPNKATSFKVMGNNNETLAQGTTSATATMKSSSGFLQAASYQIVSYKNSKQVATQPLTGTVNPWFFGNLLVPTVIVGFAIDGATGAMYKLPDTVNINAN